MIIQFIISVLFPSFFLVTIDLDQVRSDWQKSDGQYHIKAIATHHGIYEHLFGYAYFLPRVPLDIKVSTCFKSLKSLKIITH